MGEPLSLSLANGGDGRGLLYRGCGWRLCVALLFRPVCIDWRCVWSPSELEALFSPMSISPVWTVLMTASLGMAWVMGPAISGQLALANSCTEGQSVNPASLERPAFANSYTVDQPVHGLGFLWVARLRSFIHDRRTRHSDHHTTSHIHKLSLVIS